MVGLHGDLNPVGSVVPTKLDLLVDKTGETLNPVQNGLNLQLDS
jgi:hypothetical protein